MDRLSTPAAMPVQTRGPDSSDNTRDIQREERGILAGSEGLGFEEFREALKATITPDFTYTYVSKLSVQIV